LTIFWDKTGKKYNRGKGFHVLVNGTEKAFSKNQGQRAAH